MRQNNTQAGRSPPVSLHEEIIVTVEAVGGKGDGIVRKSGFVIFVPQAQKNERYKIKITKVLDKVGFGKILEKLELPPEEKIVPPPSKETINVDDVSEDFGEDDEDLK